MRKILFTLGMLVLCIKTFAQGHPLTEQDSVNAVGTVVYSRNWEGSTISDFLNAVERQGVSMKYVRFGITSPWIDKKGRGYVNRVSYSFFDDDEIRYRLFCSCDYIPYIDIYLQEPFEELSVFIKKYPLNNEKIGIEDRVHLVGTLKIKEIKYSYKPYGR